MRTAFSSAAAPSSIRKTRIGSGLVSRVMATVIGVSVRASAETVAATAPKSRLTSRYSSATEPVPTATIGSVNCQVPYPKTRADRPITHRANGGLSTVMKLPASRAPKKNAFQLLVPL